MLCATTLVCVFAGCHSHSKNESSPPVTESPAPPRSPVIGATESTPSYPKVATSPAQPPQPSSQPQPYTSSYSALESTPPSRPVAERNATAAPLEQAVTFRVNAEQPKMISQPVTLDVKFAKQPELDVPVSLNVKMPSEAERKIPVVFSVDSSKPIIVPIRFQAENGAALSVNTRSDAGSASSPRGGSSSGGLASGASNTAGAGALSYNDGDLRLSRELTTANIPMPLLAAIIGVTGLIGGTLRTLETRRVVKRQAAKSAGRDWSKMSFDERVRTLDQESQTLRTGGVGTFFANVIWGVLGAALVPACLVMAHHPLLVQIGESRAHALALFGFCLLAATIGAELLAMLMRGLSRGVEHHDRPRSHTTYEAGPGRPLSAEE